MNIFSKYRIRFNKTRGAPGRGSEEHVWRVFEEKEDGDKEYICKNVMIKTHSWSEQEKGGDEYNICCIGHHKIDKETSTLIIE